MQFQPSQYSDGAYGESLWDKYASKAPNWTPVGWLYEDEEEKAARESQEAGTSSPLAPAYSPPASAPASPPAPLSEPEKEPFYKASWFLPTVIIGGSVAVGAAILYWPKGKPLPLIGR